MSPPSSDHFSVRAIPSSGRGVIASRSIPAGTVVLNSDAPAAHVIFRQYRKEVCAHCFEYDRGRTLPVRDNDTGKVYCTERCRERWLQGQGPLGVAAWQALHKFVQARGKALSNTDTIMATTAKPELDAINAAWREAESHAQLHSPKSSTSSKGNKKHQASANQSYMRQLDPDILGLFLSGILFYHNHSETWQDDVCSLAIDEQPYKSTEDLEAHCNSFVQLRTMLPVELLPSCASTVCQTLVDGGSHNAFGIRAGSEDGEEYMGYALYPSASYFNHSCDPNLMKRRLGSTWEFMAARDIRDGEECCITYLGGDEKELSVVRRRSRLKEVWGFGCMCERCLRELKA